VGWITHQDEAVRIISDELFERTQTRTRRRANNDERLKSGGKAKYLLSGVLVCKVCGANYVIADARSYVCGGHWNGGACSNRIRVRHDSIERTLLGQSRTELQSPERCKQMAKEMRCCRCWRLDQPSRRLRVPAELIRFLLANLVANRGVRGNFRAVQLAVIQ
jgi:site-specific DNA recombinase